MSRRSVFLKSMVASLGLAMAASTATAQKVVVGHDEWLTYSNSFLGVNERQFFTNTLSWMGAGSGSSALIYTSHPWLANADFQAFLTTQGVSSTINAAPASFAGYNVIFVEGNRNINSAALTSYVQGGGNVVYFGGTGINNAPDEASYSNPFLNSFGFNFASAYSGVGAVNTSMFASQGPYGAALFTGVSTIFGDNGQGISLTAPVANVTSQLFSTDAGVGVFGAAAYSVGAVVVTPEPGSFLLVAAGLLASVPLARRRRK